MTTLAEKYRPARWEDVIGQEKIVRRIQAMMARGPMSGRSYYIEGKSGVGKTTIARLLAAEVADPMNINELDAGALNVTTLRQIEDDAQTYGMGGKNGRAYIVNESHGLRMDVVRQFLVTLERIPSHVLWVFTTTKEGASKFEDGEDASPFMDRNIRLALTSQKLSDAFAARLHDIAEAEGLNGRSLDDYKKLIQKHHNSFRAALMAIESGEMME